MRSKTLVTGATGFLGRGLVRGLLARGERVVAVVREPEGDVAAARARLVAAVGTSCDREELEVVVADVGAPGELLAAAAPRGPFSSVWHLAAVVDLGDRRRDLLTRVNVGGTAAALAVARATGARRFHHVGTAYAGGISGVPLAEAPLPEGARHRNPYERSKHDAERLVRAAAAGGLAATIYRPSIVVGDSRTGRAEVHGAFYELVRLCWLARDLPGIVLPGRPETRLDLVPVDRVVAALLALSERRDAGGATFHLVSPDAPTVGEIAAAGRRILGLSIADIRDLPPELLPWPGAALFAAAAPILAYLRDAPIFETARTTSALGDAFLAGEGGTGRWLARLLAAAAAARFGRDEERCRREARHLARRVAKGAA